MRWAVLAASLLLVPGCGGPRVEAESGSWTFYCVTNGRGGPECDDYVWTGATLESYADGWGYAAAERKLAGLRIKFNCRVTRGNESHGPGPCVMTGTITRVSYSQQKVWLTDCHFEDAPGSPGHRSARR